MNLANVSIRVRLRVGLGVLLSFLAGMTVLALSTAGPEASRAMIGGTGLALMAAGMLCGWWLSRSIVVPLQEAIVLAQRMAAGDISEPFTARGHGELLELQQSLQEMSERMFQIVSKVRSGTTAVATSAGFINGDNTALSSRTESQASSLEETASSMEELTSTVRQNADNARQANQLVASAASSAVKGGHVVDDVVTTMGSIKESSRKIVDIISVIDGIAFQTNILALNAAVEAARAGEQGRGFAVVAAEVRTLAQRSASAAKEIKTLIGDSVGKVDAGGKLVDEAGRAMKEIVSSVKRVEDIMSEIAAASAEQSSGIEEVNKAVMQIDGMTQQNANLVEQAAKTVVSLQEQAVQLTQAVSVFNLGEREFGNAEEAQALVERGCEILRNYGKQAFFDEVCNPTGQLIDRDLYLSACDENDKIIVHGTLPRLVGLDGKVVKDPDGKFFIVEMLRVARSQGNGWVDYKFVHPVTKEVMAKTAYVGAVGNIVMSCGFYKR
ncbi:methyl-accepting chemotaxis protein [Janthinobacterium sp. 17J80-10]|uniref:methyl-accepting chemotaxis protein n=1 Tax=Janthinobacterium sp. 17J80-10 TaxID=2497863 RepID=UPI0010054C51|nr:methyl-accepting chemotaxis protein [Janthinobacterium sp. 17J80-10]QAU32755.1 HAMP domain-containing protein [Janthinobacterium sp. 17J80-10]